MTMRGGTEEDPVGLLSGLMKAGLAKKVLEQAQKPQNQARARQLLQQVTSKKGKRP